MAEIVGQKYPEQIAYLRENHGFTQAHANALVLYSRGSTSSKKYDTVEQYLAQFDEVRRQTVLDVCVAITSKFPKLETVIAWNQPMLKLDTQYIFGATVLKNHILLAPWSKDVLEAFAERLSGYEVNKKTFKIPVDWKVDKKLLRDLAAARIAEI